MDISKSDVLRAHEEILNGLSEGQRLRLSVEAEREMGRRSTFYLARYILGYKDLSASPPFFHRALCRFYDQHLFDLQLHLHPRKHFKTTLLTIAGKIRLVLLEPDIAICIIANTLSNSSSFLREIKAHFNANDKFRELYPEHAPRTKREEGTTEYFTTPARKAAWKRMHTFEAASADKAIVSRHYDLLHFDDIVDDKNIATVDLRRKIYENYVTSLSTTSLNQKNLPWHHIVGTRWHFDDMYNKVLADNKEHHHFHTLISQIYWDEKGKEGEQKKRILFPEKFPQEAIDYLRKAQGEYKFSCLYLNSPVPEGNAVCDPKFLKTYNSSRDIAGPRNKVITVDPATSAETREGDPTVISAYAMDSESNIYVLEVKRGWWNPDQIVSEIIGMHKFHRINKIGIEAVSFQKWLCYFLNKEKRSHKLYFRIEPIRRDSKIKKSQRLERIIPYLREGKVYVRDDEPQMEIIKRELREYPFGKYDDFMDTLADAIELLKAPVATATESMDNFRVPPVLYKTRRHIQTGYTFRAG